jgi:hypothetical protein
MHPARRLDERARLAAGSVRVAEALKRRGLSISPAGDRVEVAMRIVEPSRTLVVKVGQRSRLQDRRRFRAHWHDARSGKPGTTSGTRLTRSGGFSQTSRNSLSRHAGSSTKRRAARTFAAVGLLDNRA